MKMVSHIATTQFLGLLAAGLALSTQASPLPPAQEQETFHFADPDIRIELVASEPDIISPVAMAWDPDGALLVVEMPGYPVRERSGRIKRLTDPDGDGRYTLDTIYADKLNFPNSVMPVRGGVLVCDAPDIIFLGDSDQDGISDHRKVLWTGFGEGNHQLRVNGLYWGLDNWIYGANGRSGGEITQPSGEQKTPILGRDFRFRSGTDSFEGISGYSQFGIAQDDWGNRFTTLNHRFARQVVLENRHVERNPQLIEFAIFDTSLSEHDRRVHTLVDDTLRFNRDPIGYFTSLSGLTAYRGTALGPNYKGSFFAGESVQNVVIHRRLEHDGPTFKAINPHSAAEFLASTDGWFHPVNFANGPDGALYLVDFYRRFVEHPQWAFDELSGGIDWNEGEPHGRIWRIFHRDRKPSPGTRHPQLARANTETLVKQLANPNGWRRTMAQQLIVSGPSTDEIQTAVEEFAKTANSLGKIHALRTLDGLGHLSENIILQALHDNSVDLQEQALRLAESRVETSPQLRQAVVDLVDSEDARIRFQAILSLGQTNEPEIQQALIRCALKRTDHWTRIALLSSAGNWIDSFIGGVFESQTFRTNQSPKHIEFVQKIGATLAMPHQGSKGVALIESLSKQSSLSAAEWALLAGYVQATSTRGKESQDDYKELVTRALTAAKQNGDPLTRELAFSVIRNVGASFLDETFLGLVMKLDSNPLLGMGIEAIALSDHPDYSKRLFDNISTFDPTGRKTMIESSLLSPAFAMALFSALEKAKLDSNEISEKLRQALMRHPDDRVAAKAKALLADLVDSDRAAVIDRYAKAIRGKTPDPKKGAEPFANLCMGCHSIQGVGGQMAPDLTGFGSRSDEVLLTSILDPSRMVSYELKLHIIETRSGAVFSGMVATENGSSVTLRQPDGELVVVIRSDIVKKTGTEKSIMPEGFERMIDEQSMADLLGFLRSPDTSLLDGLEYD